MLATLKRVGSARSFTAVTLRNLTAAEADDKKRRQLCERCERSSPFLSSVFELRAVYLYGGQVTSAPFRRCDAGISCFFFAYGTASTSFRTRRSAAFGMVLSCDPVAGAR
ncbi:hypothetical protein MTO96_030224 [Rhipicephalus appendiculatus]